MIAFLAGIQFANSILIYGLAGDNKAARVFCLLFIFIGLMILYYAWWFQGKHFYFEKQWLHLKKDEVVLANGQSMSRAELHITFATGYIETNDGEIIGRKISFKTPDREVQYHMNVGAEYNILQATIDAWKELYVIQ